MRSTTLRCQRSQKSLRSRRSDPVASRLL